CSSGHGRTSTLTPAPVPGTVLVASASARTANETASRRTGEGQGREMGAGLAFPRLALSRPDRGVRRIHGFVHPPGLSSRATSGRGNALVSAVPSTTLVLSPARCSSGLIHSGDSQIA